MPGDSFSFLILRRCSSVRTKTVAAEHHIVNSVTIFTLQVTEAEKGKALQKQAEGCYFHLSRKRPLLLLQGLFLLVAIPTLTVAMQRGSATEGTKGLDSSPASLRGAGPLAVRKGRPSLGQGLGNHSKVQVTWQRPWHYISEAMGGTGTWGRVGATLKKL